MNRPVLKLSYNAPVTLTFALLALTALVLDLHAKLQSQAHPLRWLAETRRFWQAVPDQLADTPFGEILLADLVRWSEFWSRRLSRAVEEMASCPAVEAAYGPAFLAVSRALHDLPRAASSGWDAAFFLRLR